MPPAKKKKDEPVEVTEQVWYFDRAANPGGECAMAIVTELGSTPETVNLTVFWRAHSDCMMQGFPPIDIATEVRVNPDLNKENGLERYCLTGDRMNPPTGRPRASDPNSSQHEKDMARRVDARAKAAAEGDGEPETD